MPTYNSIEYCDNYSDTTGSLWQFKRDESPVDNDGNPGNVTTDNSSQIKTNQVCWKKNDYWRSN